MYKIILSAPRMVGTDIVLIKYYSTDYKTRREKALSLRGEFSIVYR